MASFRSATAAGQLTLSLQRRVRGRSVMPKAPSKPANALAGVENPHHGGKPIGSGGKIL
jgi:hypothetical protein